MCSDRVPGQLLTGKKQFLLQICKSQTSLIFNFFLQKFNSNYLQSFVRKRFIVLLSGLVNSESASRMSLNKIQSNLPLVYNFSFFVIVLKGQNYFNGSSAKVSFFQNISTRVSDQQSSQSGWISKNLIK